MQLCLYSLAKCGAQEIPVIRMDGHHPESYFEVGIGHDSACTKPGDQVHSIVHRGIVDWELLLVNAIVDTTSMRGREMKYHPPLSVLLGDGTQPRDAIGIFARDQGPCLLPLLSPAQW